MKNKLSRILCTALCCAPLLATAQTSENITSPQRLYQEGQSLFQQKAYAAAIPPLQSFVRQIDAEGKPLEAVCSSISSNGRASRRSSGFFSASVVACL